MLVAIEFQMITRAEYEGNILVWVLVRSILGLQTLFIVGGVCKLYLKNSRDVISLPDLFLINFPAITVSEESRGKTLPCLLPSKF